MAKKARTAAQKAATRKMIAANKARRRGGKKRTKTAKRKSRPAVTVAVAASNPKRRRPRRRAAVTVRARRNPSRRAGFMGELTASIVPAVWGAGGAIATKAISGMVVSRLPLPDALKQGYGRVAVDALLATALGVFGRRFLGNKASMMASGALTLIAYQALSPLVAKVVPGMGQLPGSLDSYEAGTINGLPGALDGIGYYSPAETFGEGDEVNGIDYYQPEMGDADEMVGEYTYT